MPAILRSALLGLALAPAVSAAQIPGAYLVTLQSGDPDAAAGEARRSHGVDVAHVYRHALRVYAARMSAQATGAIARRPGVASVIPDQVVTAAAQTVPTGIDRIDGELSSTVAGDGAGAVNVTWP